jgi:hypothetical protein
MSGEKQSLENTIEAEVFFSLILSIVSIIITFNLDKGFWGSDYLTGFLRFYGGISLIFFASVFMFGIPGAMKLKPSGNITMAIVCSIAFWLLSLVVTAIAAQFLYVFSAYVMLLGIICGFHYGLKIKVKTDFES